MKCLNPFTCGHTPHGCFEPAICANCEKSSIGTDAFVYASKNFCCRCYGRLTGMEKSNYSEKELERFCDTCADAPLYLDEATAEAIAEGAEEDSL